MDTIVIVLMLTTAAVVSAVLLRREHRVAPSLSSGLNAAGAVGLASFAVELGIYDGVTILEFWLCIALIITLVTVTFGGLALERRGKHAGAVVLLAVGTAPILFVIAVLLALEAHPIRWN